MIADVVQRRRATVVPKKACASQKTKAACWPPSHESRLRYSLLADVPQSVLADEGRARLTDKAAAVSIRSVITVIGITIVAEWRGGYPTGRADRAANHTGRDIAGPEAIVAPNLRITLSLCALLLKLNSFERACGPIANAGDAIAVVNTAAAARSFKVTHFSPLSGHRANGWRARAFPKPAKFHLKPIEFRPVAALTFAINQACAHCRADAQSVSNIRGMGDRPALF